MIYKNHVLSEKKVHIDTESLLVDQRTAMAQLSPLCAPKQSPPPATAAVSPSHTRLTTPRKPPRRPLGQRFPSPPPRPGPWSRLAGGSERGSREKTPCRSGLLLSFSSLSARKGLPVQGLNGAAGGIARQARGPYSSIICGGRWTKKVQSCFVSGGQTTQTLHKFSVQGISMMHRARFCRCRAGFLRSFRLLQQG